MTLLKTYLSNLETLYLIKYYYYLFYLKGLPERGEHTCF